MAKMLTSEYGQNVVLESGCDAFWIHKFCRSYVASNPDNRYLQQQRSCSIGRTSSYILSFQVVCIYAQNGVQKRRDHAICLEPSFANLSSHAVLTKKRKTLIVEHSFVVQITHIHCIVFQLRMSENKEEQNGNFHTQFSQLYEGFMKFWKSILHKNS